MIITTEKLLERFVNGYNTKQESLPIILSCSEFVTVIAIES